MPGQPTVVLPAAFPVNAHTGGDARGAGAVAEGGTGAYGVLRPAGADMHDV